MATQIGLNGWFPAISLDGDILSGNAAITQTRLEGRRIAIAARGTHAIFAGRAPVWNDYIGGSVVNGQRLDRAYDDYRGSDDGHWAGATNSGQGQVDTYWNGQRQREIPLATCPRWGTGKFVYLTPFQDGAHRSLMVNGAVQQQGPITNCALSPDGRVLVYQTNYAQIWAEDKAPIAPNHPLNVWHQEDPVAAFLDPTGWPWVVTITPDAGTLIHPILGDLQYMGYRLLGDLHGCTARMIEGKLLVVGADAGWLRTEWIDFAAPRTDLRQPPQ